ncbi:MAG: glycine betaine ABC transporter substrate-binding protein [Alkalispirochaetaceae bacterium]
MRIEITIKECDMKRAVLLLLSLTLLGGIALASGQQEGVVQVAAQDVNETVILAHMASQIIEAKTPYETTVNTNFAASSVLHQGMEGDEIDVYPTWTGTQLTGILRYEGPNMGTMETWEYVKEGFEENFGYTWSRPLGFNNTYIMVVTEERAEELGLEKASDLGEYAEDWKLAGDENFDVRPDAYPGWSEAYGIEFKEVITMQYSLLYRAVDTGEVEVAAAYSTDSRIPKLGLTTLPDDKEFFPAYSGAYVVSDEVQEDYPEVIEALNLLGDRIPTDTMAALNSRYDDGEDPEVIARDFLTENGFLE